MQESPFSIFRCFGLRPGVPVPSGADACRPVPGSSSAAHAADVRIDPYEVFADMPFRNRFVRIRKRRTVDIVRLQLSLRFREIGIRTGRRPRFFIRFRIHVGCFINFALPSRFSGTGYPEPYNVRTGFSGPDDRSFCFLSVESGRTAPDRYICKRRTNRSASLYIKAIKLLIERIQTDDKILPSSKHILQRDSKTFCCFP